MNRRDLLALAAAGAVAGPAWSAAPAGLNVATGAGRLRGVSTGGIRVFTGIPYGRAERFRAPQPAARWSGILDATNPAARAPQPAAGPASEDCLHLNVWAPATPGPHAVLVYVHGGGNQSGWSGDPTIAGDRFAAHGIVCVTVNYRLGAFGFGEMGRLLGPAYAGSANNAMRDLIVALRWVRANIAAFGGDPRRVTLAGQSAGGKNVGTLMGAPAADGLYQRAAIFSGGAETVATPAEAEAFARIFAEQLGGAERLLTASPEAIVAAQEAARAQWPRNFPYRPMIDARFLPQVPIARIGSGSARPVPMLIGSNADESRLFLPPALADAAIRGESVANTSMSQMAALDDAYARLFPALSPAERHWRLLTAEEYGMPCLRIAQHHAARGADVFRYRLTYPAPGGALAGTTPHALDLPLFFDHVALPGLAASFGLSAQDQPLADMLHGCLVRFVTEGHPGAVGAAAWPRYEAGRRLTMVIGRTIAAVADPDQAERVAWGL